MRSILNILASLAASAGLTFCTGGADVQPIESAPTQQSQNQTQQPGSDDTPDLFDTPDDGGQGSGDIVYPKLKYKGQGTSSANGKNILMWVDLETQIDDDQLELNSRNPRGDCNGVSRCDQGELNGEIQKLAGIDTYVRTPNTEKRDLGGDYQEARFAILANEVKTKDGNVFTFSKPLPVYPWPAAKSRYSNLKEESFKFESQVEASTAIHGTSSFSVQVRVKFVSETDDTIKLSITTTIPEDRDYKLYGAFPIPKQTEYTINTEDKDVTSVKSLSYYYSDKTEKGETTDMTLTMCEKSVNGDTSGPGC